MANDPETWWDLNDFLDLRDLEEGGSHGLLPEHDRYVDEGMSVVTIDDLLSE